LPRWPTLAPRTLQISQCLRKVGISSGVDESGTIIGKRYARNEKLGTLLGMTVNFDTVKGGSVRLAEIATAVSRCAARRVQSQVSCKASSRVTRPDGTGSQDLHSFQVAIRRLRDRMLGA